MSKEELKPINCDMDAHRWAKEFMSSKFAANLPPEVDEGLMIGWFANAIMCGWDNAHWKLQASHTPAVSVEGEKAAEEHCERIWQKERGMWRGEQWAQSREDFLAGFQARSHLVELLREAVKVFGMVDCIKADVFSEGGKCLKCDLCARIDAALKGEK